MSDERLIMAIGRLERALSRAETSGDQLITKIQSTNNSMNSDTAAYQKLKQEHKELKQQASASLAAINNILEQKVDS